MGWAHAVDALGMAGLHFHDLRHTGNQFAANSGAAMIYQHGARGADKAVADAIDAHVEDHKRTASEDGDGTAGTLISAS